MTTLTSASYGAVVEADRCPVDGRRMATVALSVGSDMACVFTRGYRAVVTTRAGAGHTDMVKPAGAPGHRGMAIFAGFAGRNMICRFTDRIHIVMAGFTARRNVGVIESDIRPGGIGDMAIIARRIGLHMISRFTRGGYAIMTALTGAAHH